MNTHLQLGTAIGQPGTRQYGAWEAFTFPTGHTEFLPVIIAQGALDGPRFWLTAGIHGQEHAGPAVIYRVLDSLPLSRLRGAVVALPLLAPAGSRTMRYIPYHESKNPNRLWPDGRPRREGVDVAPPSPLEAAYARLLDSMLEQADYLIDLHNHNIGSISFAFQDRILYRADGDASAARAAAAQLAEQQDAMLAAYGHTVVGEFAAEKYLDNELHRSTSAATLFLGQIPSFTAELGGGEVPDPAIVQAAAAGIRNVLRWAGLLDDAPEPITGIKLVQPGYVARRCLAPRTPTAGVVLHCVEPGDMVQPGDVVAELRDVWGRPIGEGVLRSQHEGFVVARSHGIFYHAGQAILTLAIREDSERFSPYPADYFR